MILPLVKVPDERLTTPSKPIQRVDKRIKDLIVNMKETLIAAKDPEGVGLAAPQVGVNVRLFVTRPHKKNPVRVFINPEIGETDTTEYDDFDEENALEGCLSIDKIWAPVSRPNKVLLKYQTEKREAKEEWFEGFDAIVIQHEVDHLDGILFTKRAIEQGSQMYEEKKDKLVKMEI